MAAAAKTGLLSAPGRTLRDAGAWARRVASARLHALLGDADNLSMAASSVLAFVIRAAGVALMTLVTVLFTRLMGAEEYGRLAFLLSGSFIIVLFSGMGLPTASSRLVPRYLARGHKGTAAHYLLMGLAVVTLTAAFGGIVLALVFDLLPALFREYRFPLVGIVGLVVTISLMRFASETSRAFGLQLTGFIAESIAVRVILLAALAAIAAAGLPLRTGTALLIYVTAQALVVVAVVMLIMIRARPGAGVMRPRAMRLYRGWLGVSLVMLVTPVYYFLLFETDVLALGILAGPYDVGLYQAARRLAEFAVFCGGAASAVGLPRLARAHAERRPDKVQGTIDVMNLISVGSIVLIVIALVASGPFALRIFGPEFAQGYPVMLILAGGRLLAVLLGPSSDLLLMTGHHRRLGRVNFAFAAFNIALNVVLIPWLGAAGAAIATSTASVSWSAWLYVMSLKLTPIDTCALRRLWRQQASASA